MTVLGLALRAAAHVPEPLWRPGGSAAARLVARRPLPGVQQWQRNAQVVLGRPPTLGETRRAVESWVRNTMVSAQLHTWDRARIEAAVVADPAEWQSVSVAFDGPGAVVALPHMGSWDLAGAWACGRGMPVSTVAEQVPEFDWFVTQREALGMRVHGHRDPRAFAHLLADQRSGRLTCLVSDRAMGRSGIEVSWQTPRGPQQVLLPAGPATLARRTGATLFGCAPHFTPTGMRLVFSSPLDPGKGVAACTQQLADFFSAQVREHVVDWHMMVPFFPASGRVR